MYNDALGSYAILLSMVIWYEILFAINKISTNLQSISMCINSSIEQINDMLSYFIKFRDEGFISCINIAKSIALDMDVELTLSIKRRKISK